MKKRRFVAQATLSTLLAFAFATPAFPQITLLPTPLIKVLPLGGTDMMRVADLDGDGNMDVVTGAGAGNAVEILYGTGNGAFESGVQIIAAGPRTFGIGVGDIDHDGDIDVVVTEGNGSPDGNPGTLRVLRNDHSLSTPRQFTNTGTLSTSPVPGEVDVIDVNHDGHPDLVVDCWVTHNPPGQPGYLNVFLGNGDGTFQSRQDSYAGNTPARHALADFNGDGKLDAVVSNAIPQTMSLMIGNGDGTFQAPSTFGVTGEASGLATGDLNGDGKQDVVQVAFSYPNPDHLYVRLGDGAGGFTTQVIGTGLYPVSVRLADLDGDSYPDIVLTANHSMGLQVFRNDGTGHFTDPPINLYSGYYTYDVAPADMNGDGRLDLVTAMIDGSVAVFLNTATFTPTTVGIATSPAPNGLGWNNTGVQALLTAPGHPNLTRITYRIDGGAWVTQTAAYLALNPPTITGEGSHTIEATFTDSAGQTSALASKTVQIDTVDPATTISVQGAQVTLSASDDRSGVAATYYQIDGGATQTYAGPFSLPAAGSHALTVWSVDNAGNEEPHQAITGLGVDTALTFTTTNLNVVAGQNKSVSARLRRTDNNANLAGKSVLFKINGSTVGSDTTSASGIATITFVAPEALGSYTLTAEFAGDSGFDSASVAGTLVVSQASTTITVPAKTTQAGDTVNLSATLKRTGFNGIAGKTLTFKIDGVPVGVATTNGSGVATLPYTTPLAVDSHTITVEFAGDASYGASAGSGSLTVTKANTTLAISNRTTRVGYTVNLTARLRRSSDGAYVAGKSVEFRVGGVLVGVSTTDAGGYAYLLYTPGAVGSYPVQADFAGDAVHNPSTDNATLSVNP